MVSGFSGMRDITESVCIVVVFSDFYAWMVVCVRAGFV